MLFFTLPPSPVKQVSLQKVFKTYVILMVLILTQKWSSLKRNCRQIFPDLMDFLRTFDFFGTIENPQSPPKVFQKSRSVAQI